MGYRLANTWWSVFRVASLAVAGLALAHFFSPGLLQRLESVHAASGGIAVPHDWSHEHLVYSLPRDPQTAFRIQQDPRYWHQFYWRHGPEIARAMRNPGRGPRPAPVTEPGRGTTTATLSQDWQEDLGTGAAVGANQFPAKFSFNITTANCGSATTPDYVVFNTGLAGSSSQASIIAYDNLYSGCTGTVPSVYWQYNTGGTVATSVALSLDGTQVAFVQNSSGGSASLVILKWSKSSTLTTLTAVSNSSYRSCTAPCMTTLAMGSHTDTNSFPFYDYASDQVYVGDDNGTLYKYDGVFSGTPAADSTWATKTVSSGNKLTSPIYDSSSGNVFMGDSVGVFHSYKGTSGAVVGTSSTLGSSIADAPLVDSTAAEAYVFVGHDATGNSGVYQFSTAFTSGTGTEQILGPSPAGTVLHSGTFDNIYFSSTSATSPTGNLYVCGEGSTGGSGSDSVYRFPITNNALGSETAGSNELIANLAGAGSPVPPSCSPVTEIYNSAGSTVVDYIFMSVAASGNATAATGSGCTGACLYSFSVAAGALPASATAGLAATGGTSGIIIDNTATATGASQVYFTTLSNQTCSTSGGSGGCAVQASQSALQ